MDKYPGYRKLELRELQLIQLEAMKHIHKICIDNSIPYYLIAGSILGAVRHGGFIPWDDDIDIALLRKDYERFKTVFEKQYDKGKYFLQHYGTDSGHKPAIMRLCIKNTILDMPGYMHQQFCHNTYLDIFPLDNVPDDEGLSIKQSKRIAKLRKRIRYSDYTDYSTNNPLKRIIKIIVAKLTSIVFNTDKQKRVLEKVMMQYDNVQTTCVCSMASGYSYKRQTMPLSYYGKPTLISFEDTSFFGPEKPDLYLRHLYGDNYMIPRNKFADGHAHDVYIKL